MPRKAKKTDKPPLSFLEHPVRGARLQNEPEVRAALNPKEFFTETQHSSSLNSWVRPEFEGSVAAAPPVRRGGRKKCLSATSILDNSSQLSKKKSVCQFPSLSFHKRSRDQYINKGVHTQRNLQGLPMCVKREINHREHQIKRTASCAQYSDTPKKQKTSTLRKRNVKSLSNGAASSSRCLDQPENPSIQVTEKCSIPADGDKTPASKTCSTTDVGSVSPPPDVDTPKVIQQGSIHPSSPAPHLLQAQPCTPPCIQPPEMLVADTPERDYGVKVTWRRRKGLMLRLKERGHISDSDVLNHS
ncbi:LOW QUALITY PROTEIN: RAD9, HUS1, RAD1-interacting nuclear orphan protein 1 [Eleginops maclovinus]|uniref:LOW QUALITY PROTEIN: RAD9, HUS1, RAD1-interacting nuclear orphan protein 1 n=1 Tax=Eleginops maclovinus TaxID=56733 RepID=UPI003080BEDF